MRLGLLQEVDDVAVLMSTLGEAVRFLFSLERRLPAALRRQFPGQRRASHLRVFEARTSSGASPAPACRKLSAIRPSFSVRICDGTVSSTTSYPAGSTTLLRVTPSGRLKTIDLPSEW